MMIVKKYELTNALNHSIHPTSHATYFFMTITLFDSIKPMHISTKTNPFGFMSHTHFTIKFHFPSMT